MGRMSCLYSRLEYSVLARLSAHTNQLDHLNLFGAISSSSILRPILYTLIQLCGEREDLPLYGILIPSPSFTEDPLGLSGAGVAESMESWRGAGAEAESHSELNLILVVFL